MTRPGSKYIVLPMPKRLAKGDETVKVEFKMPKRLKTKAVVAATKDGQNLSEWLRDIITAHIAVGG